MRLAAKSVVRYIQVLKYQIKANFENKGQVTVYTVPGCTFCVQAIGRIKKRGIMPILINMEHSGMMEEMRKSTGGKNCAPQIFFNSGIHRSKSELILTNF